MDNTEKFVRQICSYNGVITSTHLDRVLLSNGRETLREVVEHPGGVTIIPVDKNGDVWCVRQFRYPMGKLMLETPAGKLEKGEDPKDCAVRELSEETGITAGELVFLGDICPTPGYCKEILYIYLALDLDYGESHPDENELLDVEKHSLDELYGMVMRNEIRDAKTIVAVLKAKAYLDSRK